MKKLGITLLTTGLLAFCAFTTFAVSHTDTTVNVQASGFNEIKIGGPYEVHITQGTSESVKYTAPGDLLKYIVIEVEHGELKIKRKINGSWLSSNTWKMFNNDWNQREQIKVYVVVNELKVLTVSGSGQALLESAFSSNSLTLLTRGSGNIQGKINAKYLEGRVSGSGSMQLSGTAEKSAIHVSGSGHFSGSQLNTSESSVLVSGSGHADVNAAEKIDATVHGSGSISYTGQPKSVTRKTSGSGEIQGS